MYNGDDIKDKRGEIKPDHKSFNAGLKDHILPPDNQLSQNTSGSDRQSHLLHRTGEYWRAPGLRSAHSCSHSTPVTAAQNHGGSFTARSADCPSVKEQTQEMSSAFTASNSNDNRQDPMRGASC